MRIISRAPHWVHWVLRVLLAALFIVSAIAKLWSVDDFELYIYSFGIFSLNLSFLAARLIIGVELSAGVMIAMGWWRHTINTLTFILLACFSLFLCYALLTGREDSCHCMGRLVEMPPAVSLLKNAVLMVSVLIYDRIDLPVQQKGKKFVALISLVLFVVSIVAPYCISVPDNWMFGPEETRFDRELLQQTLVERGLNDGHSVVAMVTPGCPYCRMTRQKLGSIAQRNHLDSTRIHYLSPEELGSELFLRITYGQRPLVVLADGGQTHTTYHYRNINEKQVTLWLQNDSK